MYEPTTHLCCSAKHLFVPHFSNHIYIFLHKCNKICLRNTTPKPGSPGVSNTGSKILCNSLTENILWSFIWGKGKHEHISLHLGSVFERLLGIHIWLRLAFSLAWMVSKLDADTHAHVMQLNFNKLNLIGVFNINKDGVLI